MFMLDLCSAVPLRSNFPLSAFLPVESILQLKCCNLTVESILPLKCCNLSDEILSYGKCNIFTVSDSKVRLQHFSGKASGLAGFGELTRGLIHKGGGSRAAETGLSKTIVATQGKWFPLL